MNISSFNFLCLSSIDSSNYCDIWYSSALQQILWHLRILYAWIMYAVHLFFFVCICVFIEIYSIVQREIYSLVIHLSRYLFISWFTWILLLKLFIWCWHSIFHIFGSWMIFGLRKLFISSIDISFLWFYIPSLHFLFVYTTNYLLHINFSFPLFS